ncbi:trehalase [Synchiropus splendidus]|uniref:trehalase n=1 Tax=Synchiropus splendidus TaxID=270530 RepID=UPI00237E59D0|nr:trehalase [Synchiropus splendidus]
MRSLLLLFSAPLLLGLGSSVPPPCDSPIYCSGPILDQVQRAKLYDDDKYFVDMKLKFPPAVVISNFEKLSSEFPNRTLPQSQLKVFLDQNFEPAGMEFEPWTPQDWHEKPKFLANVTDPQLQAWAEKIHGLWKQLGRKIRAEVQLRPELYSLIHTPHPVVVPGGRFRELYYWDSYWVLQGLLLSEMTNTSLGMIQNFLYLVNRFGFVPNGGRVYYERRSQPPFLTQMVRLYHRATEDQQFLREALPVLEKEYQFWMVNRSLEVKGHTLNRYYVEAGLPRPESYTDDLELAEGLTEDQQQQLWMDLKAGAESGWDFSSRWYRSAQDGGLADTRTSQVVPTDLNALLCYNERTLASFHRTLGDAESAARYEAAADRRMAAMEALLWDEKRGAWFDYNLETASNNFGFYPSNLLPIWAMCYSSTDMANKAVQYLKGSGALKYSLRVPTSLRDSGQQWDFPNAWPPLQHMLIEGLSTVPSEEARRLAFDLAQEWIRTNWRVYSKYNGMFEKYDVTGDGKPGGGGEYEVQLGFGWTNGVALQLLDRYGASLTSSGGRFSLFLPLLLLLSWPLFIRAC